MRLERIFLLLCASILLLSPPGWAKFGISKARARFVMHHPPAFHTAGRELQIQVTSLDPSGAMVASRYQQLLQQAVVGENFKISPAAATVLQCAVNEAAASIEQQTRAETVNVHAGYHTQTDDNGNQTQVEDCQQQQADITYLVSSGRLAVNLMATDAKTQTLLFTQLIQAGYQEESAIRGPRQCGQGSDAGSALGEALGKALARKKGRSAQPAQKGYGVRAGQLQNPQAILSRIAEEAVPAATRLVAGYDEPREVLLAVDNELKPGNAQALGGNWQQALDAWTNAAIRKTDTEAARQYNLGVAHEALAATAMRNEMLDEATAHLNDAEKCYSQALNLDAGEKYFRDTLARLQRDRQVLQKEMEREFLKQAETTSAAPVVNAAVPAPITLTIPLGGWPEGESEPVHDYRVYVRTRVGAQKEEPSEAFKQKVLASAADYGVKQGVALQVVDSEVKRLAVLRENVGKYQEDFKDAAADGVITGEERAMLRKRQQILHLSDSQVKEVEGRFQVQEKR